jgi:hypothetical protein
MIQCPPKNNASNRAAFYKYLEINDLICTVRAFQIVQIKTRCTVPKYQIVQINYLKINDL